MKQNKPFFSIITATYNRAYCLEKPINSVLNQEFQDWELIIVDDGSIDNTDEVVEKYLKDDRIKYIKLEKNSGVNVARNRGIGISKGEYIVLLDSDNEFYPNVFNKYKETIEKYSFPYMKFLCQNQDGISTVVNNNFSGYISYSDFLDEKLSGEYQTLVETNLLKKHLFCEDINGGEGITWKCIAKETSKVLFIPEVAIIYHDDGDDRLSIRSKNHFRLSQVFKKDLLLLWKEYLAYAKFRLVKNIVKYFIYIILSKIN